MKKIICSVLFIALTSNVSMARTMRNSFATRVAEDRYVLADGTNIITIGCTETANYQRVIVDSNGIESKITFLDENDEVEEVCDLKIVPKFRNKFIAKR